MEQNLQHMNSKLFIFNYSKEKITINNDILNKNFKAIKFKQIIGKKYFIEKNKLNLKQILHFIYLFIIKEYIYFLFFLSYLLFYLSLEKCLDGIAVCTTKELWIKTKIVEELLSCLIISILIELIFYSVISKLHLFHLAIVLIIFYKYSHGLDFDDHGFFNILGFFIVIIIFLLSYIPFNIFIYLKKIKKKKYIFFLIFFLFIISIGYQLTKRYLTNCYDWPKGLNNSYIYNNSSIYGCQIIMPIQCPYKIGKYFLDITKIKGIKCENNQKNGAQPFSKLSSSPYLNKTFNRIGYPLTNKDPICFLDCIDNENDDYIKKYFFQNIIDMENKQILETVFKDKKPEIEIDFSNNKAGEMIINLYYNKTLSKERKIKEFNSKPYSNNIMILYIDSVSRANSIRQLKKTLKFFEKFISYKGGFNKKYPSENFHSFQFFKYHSFMSYTQGNYPILYYGRTKEEKIVLITKYLKENGYITSYVNDLCSKENIRTQHNFTKEEIYDHQFLLCDPNAKHFNSNTIKCLYGKMIPYHLYEYGNQFWRKYKNNRKFLNIITNDGHEGTLELLKYLDDIIYNFLNIKSKRKFLE